MIRVELGSEVDNNIGLFKRCFINKLIILNAFKLMVIYDIKEKTHEKFDYQEINFKYGGFIHNFVCFI